MLLLNQNMLLFTQIPPVSKVLVELAKQQLDAFKEARKGFFGCYSVCETMKDTKEG